MRFQLRFLAVWFAVFLGRERTTMLHGYRYSVSERIFRICDYGLLGLLGLLTIYPFWYIIQASFGDPTYKTALCWPRGFFYHSYWLIFTSEGLGRANSITVLRVLVAVPLMLMVTGAAAFALTRKELKSRRIIITYYFITMFINGGLIPLYMLLKTVGLLNAFWVFVFPVVFGVAGLKSGRENPETAA